MHFNIKQIPFSRFGSYLSISYLANKKGLEEGLYLRNIRGGDDDNGAIFKLDVIHNGKLIPFNITLNSTSLLLQSDKGYVKFVYPEDDYVHFYGENVGLQLSLVTNAYDNAFWHKDDQWQVNVFSRKIRYMLTPQLGKLDMDLSWEVNGCSYVHANFLPDEKTSKFEGMIEEFLTVYNPKAQYMSFDEAEQKVQSDYKQWFNNTLPIPDKYVSGKQLASYITWSSVVEKEGFLPRKAMYMSKNWMTNIWSWDHCFNAMALAKNNPEFAWDQFMIFFDVQTSEGQLPDYMNDQFAYWNCSKPPIHGWTLSWMLKRMGSLSKDKALEIYQPLVKWTNWFFDYRDVNNNGLPEYHHGNDSGWDNSTVFHKGIPVESPDLCTFLILQMDTLAQLADLLNEDAEKEKWENAANETLHNMLDYFWDGNQFVAKHLGEKVGTGDSLLLFMPILLGDRLPEHITKKLINGLKEEGRFLTDHGLATESISSPYYVDDGYWRGPIWAPSTMLLIDGLASAGETAFASELSQEFCNMALENGMAENFNAKTGEGLRDRAFTWTSSVFLILANEYIIKE